MPPRTRPLTVVVGADTKSFQKGMKDADQSLDKFGKNATKRSQLTAGAMKGLGVAAVGATAGVAGLVVAGKSVVSAYSDAQASMAKVKTTVDNAGISFDKHAKQIDKVIQAHSRLTGFDDEDLAESFANMVRTTGSLNEAFKLNALAADIARSKGIDLAGAQSLLARVYNGSFTGVKRLGVAIEPVTAAQDKLKTSTKNASDQQEAAAKSADKVATRQLAISKLTKAFGGQAEAYGKTNAGAMDRFHVAVENLQESLGQHLAPAVTKGANAASKFVEQMTDGTGQGGRFVDKLKEIRDEVEPIVTKFASAAKSVARFASAHPEVVKLAIAAAAVGTAIKAIRFAGAISGFSAFLSAGKTAASGLVKIMRGAGQRAGEAAAANAAEGMANQFGPSLDSRKGKFTTAGRGVGRAVGLSLGSAMGAAAVAVAGAALLKWLSQANDQLEKKGGLAGLAGKISNIGESIATHLPGSAGDVSRAIIGNGSRKAGGGRIAGAPVAADTVPALLSPQEFVVTGGGEQMLESMTFPGVLNWLEGAQPSHFQNGGRPKRMATGGRPAGQVYAGYQAGLEGQHVSGLLSTVLGYVGEPHKKKDRALASTGSAGAAPADAPSAVSAMLARAARYAGGPYDYGGGHGGFGVRGGNGGFDCSGYVSAILGPGVLSSPMAVVQPMASALLPGDGQYVTVGMRGSSGMNAHTMIDVAGQYFESGGGHGASRVGGWNGSFQHYHPRGLRRGGRVGMKNGGRVPGFLNTIATGTQTQIRKALSAVSPILADKGNLGSLQSYITAANRKLGRKGLKAVNKRGLVSFIRLAQGEFGQRIGVAQAGIDTTEGGFDQASTDLGNQLITAGASDADVAGRQGALATSQLNQLYKDRAGLVALRARAVRSGSKKTVKDIDARLATNQSDIYAKQAAVVGFGKDLQTAQSAGVDDSAADAMRQAIEDNTAAQKAHTDALTSVATALDAQTKFAQASSGTQANQLMGALTDYLAGQFGTRYADRSRTAGTGAIAVNY